MALLANSWGRRRLNAAGLHRRNVWQNGGLRSRAVGFGHGEMAIWTLEKRPILAIFHHFFDGFLRVFRLAFPSGRKMGANLAPNSAGFEPRPIAAWFKWSPPEGTLQTVNGRIVLRADVQRVTPD